MDDIKLMFLKAKTLMDEKTDFVFVTIIASSGSSPRGAGSRMLVLPDGSSCGTIGGGNVEYLAQKHALRVLEEKTSHAKSYKLHPNEVADLGMICGGDVRVYFQYISHTNEAFFSLCCRLLEDWDKNRDSWLLLDITDETAWSAGFYGSFSGVCGLEVPDIEPLLKTNAVQTELNGRKYYSEPLQRAGFVYIFGGGHVAQSLVPLLSRLNFRCIVFDDREAFSNSKVFPDAFSCITGDFEKLLDLTDIGPEDYVCIMSRGHQYDYLIQKQVLCTRAHYIGVMGSRRKSAAIREKLLNDGFTEEQTARFKTPIGLSIKAETPAEIAVSIAGELIEIRAKRTR